ncbi:MAG: transcription termination factor NusA [Dehalococcoidia bacterium]|nr:transcription termination factor NusA [Dehalococcoidia bacterium]
MKSEFMVAITQLAAEKNLPKDTVLAAVEQAIASAYRKELSLTNEVVTAKVDQNTGNVRIFVRKTVVDSPTDSNNQISLVEARKIKKDAKVGDSLDVEATTPIAGRITAQKAKQLILKRLHDAEHQSIYDEFASRAGTIVTGVVRYSEPGHVVVDLGRAEAILPESEQVRGRHYRPGQRLKLYLMEPLRTARGPQIIVSHSHPNLLRKLLEVEIPEIASGNVEIKAVAREAGSRSKVAVAARQEGIDPVGSCVGLRGIRIQNLVNELNGEKIDVVQWVRSPAEFIANALSPAQVLSVELREAENAATVIVPEKQLSLAIGRDGQNARLAAKLTGWRIDIKAAVPVTAETRKPALEEKPVEAKVKVEEKVEKPAEVVVEVEKKEEAEPPLVVKVEEKPSEVAEKVEEMVAVVPGLEAAPQPEPVAVEEEQGGVSIEEVVAAIASHEKEAVGMGAGDTVLGKSGIRFAEDILMPSQTKAGKKKKKMTSRDEVRGGRVRRQVEEFPLDEE